MMPPINVLDDLQPTRVVNSTGKFREPRTQAVGDSVKRPDANLSVALDRVLPPIRLFQSDAENSHNRFAAHCGAKFLSVLSAGPRRSYPAAGLPVSDQCPGQ